MDQESLTLRYQVLSLNARFTANDDGTLTTFLFAEDFHRSVHLGDHRLTDLDQLTGVVEQLEQVGQGVDRRRILYSGGLPRELAKLGREAFQLFKLRGGNARAKKDDERPGKGAGR